MLVINKSLYFIFAYSLRLICTLDNNNQYLMILTNLKNKIMILQKLIELYLIILMNLNKKCPNM